jgi:hypothetical protein
LFPSSPIPAWVDTLGQWLKAQRQTMSGLTKPDTKGSAQPPADRSAIIHYEGFHGTPSRCHVVHRLLDDRILFAFGGIEAGGTSPTNMIEELATAMWKRFYCKDRFDRIEWFDAWPEHYSLTDHFHIQRVHFRQSGADGTPVWWRISADVPEDFVAEVRRVISVRPDAASVAVTMDDVDETTDGAAAAAQH